MTATSLSGSVAIGTPLAQAVLRILDAGGNVVASNVAIDASGNYANVALTGTGPWRLEACGYAGANWRCIYSIAQAAGTANVTPVTSALITLASGLSPDTVMQGGASAPTAAALASAQTQLQTALAGSLTSAGVGADLDFTTGALAAGTRTGYDRLLDEVEVTTGTDSGAFVQATPRLGDGNLYMTTGTTQGAITTATGAAALPLSGVTTLFQNMTSAVASAAACADPAHGIASLIASDARMNMGDGQASGRAAVGAGLCMYFGGQAGGGSGAIWGSSLVNPTLGRCDLGGADPICAVGFVLQGTDGSVQSVGDGTGVIYRAGVWQFYGDVLPVSIHANAAVQRARRVDDPTTPDHYTRALQFDIAVTPGVACAQLGQRDSSGAATTLAYYKVFAPSARRMSLWTGDGMSNAASLDPATGAMRSADDTWIALPDGSAGDDVVRNFYRGGRTVTVSLFSDAACTAPALIGGRSTFAVDIQGVPPVWAAMPSLAWGDLSASTRTALQALALAAGTAGSLDAAWSFSDGATGFDQIEFCTNGSCGQGSDVRIGDVPIRPSARSATVPLRGPVTALAAGDYKMFVLGGRDGAGMNVESSFFSCTSAPVGQMCRN
ncbi:MAG: hypothetical protein M3O01_05140 [Pseudomonadota bacterium]|nr:hypothetical protein [Pseudomonadota bacterium]